MDTIADIAAQTRTIRTEAHPNCPLCGASGRTLYEGLRDRLFDVPGTWGFRRCSNTSCGHVWLDPRPIEADLPLVYEKYYTHESRDDTLSHAASRSLASRALRLPVKLAYAAFLKVIGLSSARQRAYAMYLTGRAPGRLLEIGCGSGERLAHMAKQGWKVVGQDVDPKAVDHARKTYGLNVHLGPVDSLPISFGIFDAVVMNHVIEHVASPVKLLQQSAARLAPGGVLVAATPNVESLGHRWFKKNWYALDPPRHIHLFSSDTLSRVATAAGLQSVHVTTSAATAEGIGIGSWSIRHCGRFTWKAAIRLRAHAASKFFQIVALLYHSLNRESGEECVLFAQREVPRPHPAASLSSEKNKL